MSDEQYELTALLPSGFVSELEASGITDISLIENNPWKGRWVFKGVCDDVPCLIKWNESGERFCEHEKLLSKEISVYKCLQSTGTVPKIFIDKPGLCTEYLVDSKTMRQRCLESNGDIDEMLELTKKALEQWALFVKGLDQGDEGELDFVARQETCYRQFRAYSGSLSSSGPLGTTGPRFAMNVGRAIKKIFMFAHERPLVNLLGAITSKPLPVLHGDFHLNNILVKQETNEMYLIDLENVGEGVPEMELAYFHAQLWALSDGDLDIVVFEDIAEKACAAAGIQFDSALLKLFSKVMMASVSLNGRFGIGEKYIGVGSALRLWRDARREIKQYVD